MTQAEKNRRFWQVMAGLFLLMIGIATLGNSAGLIPIFVVLAGLYMLSRSSTAAGLRQAEPVSEAEWQEIMEQPARHTSGAEQVYAHAIEAVRQAGRDPGETPVLPVDIGVIALRAGESPVVHRSQPVNDDVDYIQPFVQLRLPQRATGRIKFELVDSDGQTLFVHEDFHQLERGRNLVTPSARLPIHDAQATQSEWELRVSADGVLLASHPFGWHERAEKTIRRHIREDGEVTNELGAAILENQPGDLSLDDLLAYQEEQRQARRA